MQRIVKNLEWYFCLYAIQVQLNQICGVREETSTNLSPKNTVQIQFSLIPVNPPKSTYTLQANDAGRNPFDL